MRTVIQRVLSANVKVGNKIVGEINEGLLVFVGIEDADTDEDIDWLCRKIINIRIFNDANGVMNDSIINCDGDILAVSQFTLQAQVKKGNRPSYIKASKGEFSLPMYNKFCAKLSTLLKKEVKTGVFGADMKVALINNGPTTIWMDSKNKD